MHGETEKHTEQCLYSVKMVDKNISDYKWYHIRYCNGVVVQNNIKITVKALYLRHNMGSCTTDAGTGVKKYINKTIFTLKIISTK
jgi:hypothetical protein